MGVFKQMRSPNNVERLQALSKVAFLSSILLIASGMIELCTVIITVDIQEDEFITVVELAQLVFVHINSAFTIVLGVFGAKFARSPSWLVTTLMVAYSALVSAITTVTLSLHIIFSNAQSVTTPLIILEGLRLATRVCCLTVFTFYFRVYKLATLSIAKKPEGYTRLPEEDISPLLDSVEPRRRYVEEGGGSGAARESGTLRGRVRGNSTSSRVSASRSVIDVEVERAITEEKKRSSFTSTSNRAATTATITTTTTPDHLSSMEGCSTDTMREKRGAGFDHNRENGEGERREELDIHSPRAYTALPSP